MRATAPCRTPIVVLAALAAMAGCVTSRDQLVRSQAAFERGDHDAALGLLVDLEPAQGRLPEDERARYAYMRGMSDYRLGYRADARHWLALARAREESAPGVLPAEWRARAVAALAELEKVLLEEGYEGLAANRRHGEDRAKPSP